jgi:hypothetical protein
MIPPPLDAMHVYARETDRLIARFLQHHMTFPEYVAASDATLSRLIPGLLGESLPRLRALMLANHDTVMAEMVRRSPPVERDVQC